MEKQEEVNSSIEIQKDEETRPSQTSEKKHKKQPKKKRNLWSVKITVVSFFVSAFISFLSELTSSSDHIIVTILLLFFLVLCSILFDGIGVASTSCDMTPFVSMASRKVYGAKTALWLVKNNEKVSNVCNDVIGDIFGIISGACAAAITLRLISGLDDIHQKLVAVSISGVVSAFTIGGKAFLKSIAIKNSKEFIMFIARLLAVFNPEERRKRKVKKDKHKKHEEVKEKEEKEVKEQIEN